MRLAIIPKDSTRSQTSISTSSTLWIRTARIVGRAVLLQILYQCRCKARSTTVKVHMVQHCVNTKVQWIVYFDTSLERRLVFCNPGPIHHFIFSKAFPGDSLKSNFFFFVHCRQLLLTHCSTRSLRFPCRPGGFPRPKRSNTTHHVSVRIDRLR